MLHNREAGESPARSRHCNGEVRCISHWSFTGKAQRMKMPESGDLPASVQENFVGGNSQITRT